MNNRFELPFTTSELYKGRVIDNKNNIVVVFPVDLEDMASEYCEMINAKHYKAIAERLSKISKGLNAMLEIKEKTDEFIYYNCGGVGIENVICLNKDCIKIVDNGYTFLVNEGRQQWIKTSDIHDTYEKAQKSKVATFLPIILSAKGYQ